MWRWTLDPLGAILACVVRTPAVLEKLLVRTRLCPPMVSKFIGSIHVDAPLTFLFLFLCVAVMAVDTLSGDQSFALNNLATPPFHQFSPFTTTWRQWRHRPLPALRVALRDCANLFTGSFAHSDWGHLRGNVVSLLLVAPTCECALGAHALLKIMAATSFASSAMHLLSTFLLGKDQLFVMGASDVVFSFIILNSLLPATGGSAGDAYAHGGGGGGGGVGAGGGGIFDGVRRGKPATRPKVPLSFVLQVGLWCWKEFAAQFLGASKDDGISHLAHLTGAAVGTWFGWKHVLRSAAWRSSWRGRAVGFVDSLLRPTGVAKKAR